MPNNLSDLLTITVDRDTANVPGSPDIGDTIFDKIDKCDLFIADLTLINNKHSRYRRTPNPNVLIELGYAIKALGWDRILLLQCKDYGDVEELPFDINHRRIINYSLGLDKESEEERKNQKTISKNNVTDCIIKSIKLLLDKNLLFGGKKGKVPKFEITHYLSNGIMKNMILIIKNVSSILISELQLKELWINFSDGKNKTLECKPFFKFSSLNSGESTELQLNNQILGAGPGHNNYAWSNFELKMQFSCKDEDGIEFWYEMSRHIDDANNPDLSGIWPVKYIG